MDYYQTCNLCHQLASLKCVCQGSEFFGCPQHIGSHLQKHTDNLFELQNLLISVSQQEALSIEKAYIQSQSILQSRIQRILLAKNRVVQPLLNQIHIENERSSTLIKKLHNEQRQIEAYMKKFRMVKKLSIAAQIKFGLILRELKRQKKLTTSDIKRALLVEQKITNNSIEQFSSIYTNRNPQQLWNSKDHTNGVWSVCVSPCSRFVCSGSDDKTVRVWNINTGALLRTMIGHSSGIGSVDFSPDSKLIASGSDDRSVKIWEGQQCIQTLRENTRIVWSVCFSECGRFLASGSTDMSVRVWSTETWSLLSSIQAHIDRVGSVKFSRCGRWMASGSKDSKIKIWSMDFQTCLQTMTAQNMVYTIAFSPSANILASGTFKTVELWAVPSGDYISALNGHLDYVYSVSFSNCGHYLASGSLDKTVILWDLSRGVSLQTLSNYSGCVYSVCFSRSGQFLATGTSDKFIRVWGLNLLKYQVPILFKGARKIYYNRFRLYFKFDQARQIVPMVLFSAHVQWVSMFTQTHNLFSNIN